MTCLSVSPDSNYLVTGSRDTTVLLWRIHRKSTTHSSSLSEPSSGSGTPTSTSSSSLANALADKSRGRRIEGPIHVLRGHLREIICCCVNSDLGIVASCSHSSDVLLHSIRKGRLIRRLVGLEADAVCLSSDGVLLTWSKSRRALSTFTLNGGLIKTAVLPLSCNISCMEVSVDGQSALVGVNSCSETHGACDQQSDDTIEDSGLEISSTSICFLDLHTLKV